MFNPKATKTKHENIHKTNSKYSSWVQHSKITAQRYQVTCRYGTLLVITALYQTLPRVTGS